MTHQRFIIEMGMGNDLHGKDYTKAACRAVENALHGASLALLGNLPALKKDLQVRATIGVQEPDQVDVETLKKLFPVGEVSISVTLGGLNSGEAVIAQAAVEAFLPRQA
ncbi:MAG: Lin0512 family protein [Paracoccaceae bacterium]|nr:Lin0512 family protein [Paracoccaceae bacterium]MDG2259676.1 Lin0512 family protein [Paracoccaceae bacterium]